MKYRNMAYDGSGKRNLQKRFPKYGMMMLNTWIFYSPTYNSACSAGPFTPLLRHRLGEIPDVRRPRIANLSGHYI